MRGILGRLGVLLVFGAALVLLLQPRRTVRAQVVPSCAVSISTLPQYCATCCENSGAHASVVQGYTAGTCGTWDSQTSYLNCGNPLSGCTVSCGDVSYQKAFQSPNCALPNTYPCTYSNQCCSGYCNTSIGECVDACPT